MYWRLPEDGDISLQSVAEFVFRDNLKFYKIYVHMLVYINH